MTLWESQCLEEFSMSISLLNSMLLKEEFIQRSGFTSEPPIVAVATFPKILKKIWTLLVDFVEAYLFPLCYTCGLFETSFFSGISLGLQMFSTI